MKCDRCHRERNRGKYYTFYYGHKSTSRYLDASGIGVQRVTVTGYQLVGRDTAWICSGCVWRSFWLRILFFVAAVGFWAVLMGTVWARGDLLTPETALYGVGAAAVSLVLLGLMLAYFPATPDEVGERVAIGAKRREWRKKGYRSFLTGHKLERLQKSGARR